WHSIPLFVGLDDQSKVVARAYIKLLVCPLRAESIRAWNSPVWQLGDWGENSVIKSALTNPLETEQPPLDN
ncbi:MAG: hypothetical protein ACXWC8_21190, partial [Limisphaerales bacterium]